MRLGLAAVAACALLCGLGAPAARAQVASDNVSLVAKLPEAAGAISARFSPDGKLMYVSTLKALHIYDVSEPDAPGRLGVLPLPHFENEDVDAGDGFVLIANDPSEGVGLIYIIDVRDPALPAIRSVIQNGTAVGPFFEDGSSYTGHTVSCIQACRYIWAAGTSQGISIFDIRDLDAPRFVKSFKMPEPFGDTQLVKGITHDVFVDRQGIGWVTGSDGTFGYTTDDPENPRLVYRSDEKVVFSNNVAPLNPDQANESPIDLVHHNSIRTDIQLAGGPTAVPTPSPTGTPSVTATPTGEPTTIPDVFATAEPTIQPTAEPAPAPPGAAPAGPTIAALGAKPKRPSARKLRRALRRCGDRAACKRRARAAHRAALRRYERELAAWQRSKRRAYRTTLGGSGDVVAVTEEDYQRPTCNGQGSFQTWQITPGTFNSDGSTKLELLDLWTTELDGLAQGNGRSPATINCSAHWFDIAGGIVAQGWYDQGLRFLDITNPREIRQVGYWITPGSMWAAYYAPSDPKREIVYALDAVGGIDVVRLDRSASIAERTAPIPNRWMSGVRFDKLGRGHATFGFACPQLLVA